MDTSGRSDGGRLRVVCVAGARPNFMKVKPVVSALEQRGVEVVLVHSGQHYDRSMSDVFFEDLDLRQPDHHLGVGSGSHAKQMAGVMTAFEPLVEQLRPDAESAGALPKALLRANTDEASARGVFGVPAFEVEGRLFWGLDSLPMLRAYLDGDAWFDGPAWDAAPAVPSGLPSVR